VTTKAKKEAEGKVALNPPSPARQVQFHQLLVAARKLWFMDALSEALAAVDPKVVKQQITEYVPEEAQKVLAGAGIRDEHVFPVPAVLEKKPSLVGYYRLLLGAPQKRFYTGATGMGRFKSMEEHGILTAKTQELISDFCRAMAQPLAELVQQIPDITKRDLQELPVLTYGAQLQGSNNTRIGKEAMKGVFLVIGTLVEKYVVEKKENRYVLKNSAGRTVVVSLAHDPDVSVREMMPDNQPPHAKVAIEVKGGTDVSNAHNRAGEAEKSHLKAKKHNFKDFWTIISKKGVQMATLRNESQTTTEWFDVTEILARKGPDWDNFRQRLATVIGIPIVEDTKN
jgi:hypothetical protein